LKAGLNSNQLLIIDEVGKQDFRTITSAILSVSRCRDLPEATVRFNFNSLVKKGVIDRTDVCLTSLGELVLGLNRGDCRCELRFARPRAFFRISACDGGEAWLDG